MDVIDCIRTRHSIRKYKEQHVEWEKVGMIVQSGLDAPSSGNLQNWKFVVVQEKDKRRAIAEACLQQYWMEKAPVHIVVCAEPQKTRQFYGVRGERLYSTQNCAAAVQNMLLTAHSLGLGACWVGAFEEEMMKKALGIPDYVRPQAVLTIGYPAEEAPSPSKYRLHDMVFLEKWENRIKDINWVMKEYSTTINKKLAEGVKKVSEHGKKAVRKGRKLVDTIRAKK